MQQSVLDPLGLELESVISMYVTGFQDLPDEKEPQELVREFRTRIEATIKKIDVAMTTFLSASNPESLKTWAARVQMCISHLYVLDKNLSFVCQPQWNWDEVIQSMAILDAIRVTSSTILGNEGVYLE